MHTSRFIAVGVGLILLLVGAAAIIWAFIYVDSPDIPTEIPDYALNSETILRAEWALAATLAVAAPLLLIGRLLTGRFPDRISAQGAEWLSSAPEVIDALDDLRADSDAVEAVVDDILEILDETVGGLRDHEVRIQKLEANG